MPPQRWSAQISLGPVLFSFVAFAFIAFAPMAVSHAWAQQAPVVTDAQPQDALVVLQLGACEGECPVYKLVIFADATTIFEGRFYVSKTGIVRGKIPREALGKILADAEAMQFFELKSRYVPSESAPGSSAPGESAQGQPTSGECLTPKSNAPTAILTISANGRTKTIVHFRGCAGADAQRLTQFEDRIAAAADISKFTK